MKTPTQQVLKAIASLEGDRDFLTVMDWLEESRGDAVDKVICAPEERLTAAREQLRTLTNLQKTIRTARQELRTMAEISANTASADRQLNP